MKASFTLGLDVGIASVGYALVDIENQHIIASGVRCFTQAENPKNGASLALPRREKRSIRRVIRRRASRIQHIRALIDVQGLLTNISPIDHLNPWELRKKGLDHTLSGQELACILIHIAKRRGFQSNRKSEESKNEGDLLKGIKRIQDEAKNYRTVGEMFALLPIDTPKRNKGGKYTNTIPRALLQEEIRLIFATQRTLENPYTTTELEEEYIKLAFTQRPLKSVAHMIGYCTFETGEKRAPKLSYSAELFVLYTKMNNLLIQDKNTDKTIELSIGQRSKILAYCLATKKVTFSQIRKKALDLPDDLKFSTLDYKPHPKNPDKNPEDAVFAEMRGYHMLRETIGGKCGEIAWHAIKNNVEMLDSIATILTVEKGDNEKYKALCSITIPEDIASAVKELSMDKVQHLSLKAIRAIIPYMAQGQKYYEACHSAGYNHSMLNSDTVKGYVLPPLIEDIPNPVVNRAFAQSRKLINAIIRKYGMPDKVNIELARDLSRPKQEREKIKKAQEGYRAEKENAANRCHETLGLIAKGKDILKFRLWEEQKNYCIYSGKYIEPARLNERGYVEVDHILPYSRSMDDSMNNKVLCLAQENQNKGDKTPYEYFGHNQEKWEQFTLAAWHLKKPKRDRLLRKNFDEKEAEGFRERNLNDTRYIGRLLSQHLQRHLDFKDSNKINVQVRSGSLTAFLRHQWGLEKDREEGDKHHAQDAIVIACSTQGMVQKLAAISRMRELREADYSYKDHKPRFTAPWENFSQDVEASLEKIFVSRMPRRTVTGEAHEETIRSAKYLDDGIATVRTSISSLKLKDLERLHDKERNMALYSVLKSRLETHNDDPKKAFAEPVYMPTTEKAKQQPVIRSVTLYNTQKSGLRVQEGIADNGGMVRVDVFEKPNKKGKMEFYLVPIYIADMVKKELPNRAVIAYKDENDWLEMDKDYHFKFSLYSCDCVAINKTGKPEDTIMGYYTGCNRRLGCISIDAHDRSSKWDNNGVKTLSYIKKYEVDYLGYTTEIKQEKRCGLAHTYRQQELPPQAGT